MLRALPFAILILTLNLTAGAQMGGSTGPGRSVPTSANPPDIGMPMPDSRAGSLFVSGKVVVDDGTSLTDRVAIQSFCGGRTHVEAYTDLRGQFSFEIKSPTQSQKEGRTDDASDSSATMLKKTSLDGPGRNANPLLSYLRDCQLRAVMPGFISGTVELASKGTDVGPTDVGTLTLHRIDRVEGLTISVTTAQASSKARQQYKKGRDLEKKEKWDAALQSFQHAVAEYPKFAVAWFEIGRIQAQKNDLATARQSFHQSIAADSKFVSPFHELAKIALQDKQWQELVDVTGQLLKLNPVDFPHDWLLNAVGNFNLNNFDAAEASALKGVEVDPQHEVPKLEYMLGLALAQKHDYANALEHMRTYLRIAPFADDTEAIRRQAYQIEKLSLQAKAEK